MSLRNPRVTKILSNMLLLQSATALTDSVVSIKITPNATTAPGNDIHQKELKKRMKYNAIKKLGPTKIR